MREPSAASAPLVRSGRRLRARLRSLRDGAFAPDSSLAFGIRLWAAAGVTCVLVGVSGYVLLEHKLASRRISDMAAAQRADVTSLESYGPLARTRGAAVAGADRLLVAFGRRPGMVEAKLIDGSGVVVASANQADVGTRVTDAPVEAALRRGVAHAGRESDPREDRRNFEFVAPVQLKGARYAYEVTRNHRAYDAEVHDVRVTLGLIGLVVLVLGGSSFYLVGGRRLMRDHRRMLRRATRDGLTDLANQRAFEDELSQAVAAAARYEHPLALALLDADDFKLVNDRHGHPHGDHVLKRIAGLLREVRPSDRPYRIGGDEFALLLAHTDAAGARRVAERLRGELAAAGIAASLGVSALRPGHSADALRAEADAALYEAKRLGGGRVASFEDIRGRITVTTAASKQAVRQLIEDGAVTTVFQPILDLGDGSLVGLEALTRPNPRYGLSGPAEAFDVAEQMGRVHQLDALCVERALESAPPVAPGVLLFVNVSPLTLDLDSEGNDWLREAVERHGLCPGDVVVEVTERFGGRLEPVAESIRRLHEQGFRIALDDVGTGNSGLEMLRAAQPEFVKIDRSVVAAAPTEPGARAVLMAMAAFARQTGAFVIAEGIEDQDMLRFLRSIDVRQLTGETVIQGGQGFELGSPAGHLPGARPFERDPAAGVGASSPS